MESTDVVLILDINLLSKICSSVLSGQMFDVISYIFPIEFFVFNTKLPDMSDMVKQRILQQQEKLLQWGLICYLKDL